MNLFCFIFFCYFSCIYNWTCSSLLAFAFILPLGKHSSGIKLLRRYVHRVYYCTKMGSGESKHEETKAVDTSGAVNNNLVFNPSSPVPIHYRTLEILIWIICIVKVLELCYGIYRAHQKYLKKKYFNNGA